MGAHLDITDVIHGHPRAEREYAELLAERDRYKAALERIASGVGGSPAIARAAIAKK